MKAFPFCLFVCFQSVGFCCCGCFGSFVFVWGMLFYSFSVLQQICKHLQTAAVLQSNAVNCKHADWISRRFQRCAWQREPSSRSTAWWLFLLPPPSSSQTLQNLSLHSARTLCPLGGSVPKARIPVVSWHGWQLLACRFQSKQRNRSSAELDDSTSVQPRSLFCVQDVWR